MSYYRLGNRSGYTLIEILLAVTLGLVLLLGVVQMFAMVGNFVTGSQGLMELDQKVRSAQIMLQNDLSRYTARMTTPASPNSGAGYFRIEEKTVTPANADTRLSDFYSNAALPKVIGDYDDVLSFTIHDLDSPFIGRGTNSIVHSPDAEVKWFVYKNNNNIYSLYRRVYVLDPTTGKKPSEVSGNIKYASLSDLTYSQGSANNETSYRDKDVTTTNAELILDNIIIFDVKVWDPDKKQYVDLGSGTSFNVARGTIFDTGSQFKATGANSTTIADTGTEATNNRVINAPDLNNFSVPNSKMAGISLQGIQIHVRTFDPASGILRDFTVEQEFVTH